MKSVQFVRIRVKRTIRFVRVLVRKMVQAVIRVVDQERSRVGIVAPEEYDNLTNFSFYVIIHSVRK